MRIRPEIDGKLAVLLVIGRVKAIVVKVAQRKIERVKTELQRVALKPDFQDAVSRILIIAGVVRQRMRWLCVWNSVTAGLRARFRACFLSREPLLELALAPGRLVHAEKPLVHVVADDVVQRSAMIADHQNNHANLVVGHEGNL